MGLSRLDCRARLYLRKMFYSPTWDRDITSLGLSDAAQYLRKHGWCREMMRDQDGHVCLMGAIINSCGKNAPEVRTRLGKYIRERYGPVGNCPVYVNDRLIKNEEEAIKLLEAASFWRPLPGE